MIENYVKVFTDEFFYSIQEEWWSKITQDVSDYLQDGKERAILCKTTSGSNILLRASRIEAVMFSTPATREKDILMEKQGKQERRDTLGFEDDE